MVKTIIKFETVFDSSNLRPASHEMTEDRKLCFRSADEVEDRKLCLSFKGKRKIKEKTVGCLLKVKRGCF